MIQFCLAVISNEVPCLCFEGELFTTEFHCRKNFSLMLNLKHKRIPYCHKFSLLRRGLFVLWGGLEERKGERAGHVFSSSYRLSRAFYFFDHAIFIGIPSGSPGGGESQKIESKAFWSTPLTRQGTQRQFSENICSENNLRSRIFGAFAVLKISCLPASPRILEHLKNVKMAHF